MAADSGALSVIDAAVPAVDSAVTETPTTDSNVVKETPSDSTNVLDKPTTEKTSDDSAKTEIETKGSISNPAPGQVTKALQEYKNADPANAEMAKMLNNIYRREFEYGKTFGSVTEAKAISTLLREVTGAAEGTLVTAQQAREHIQGMRDTVTAAQNSDSKLYDPEQNADLVADVVADLKEQGRIENLGPLTKALLESMKTETPQQYLAHQRVLFLSTATESGLVESLNSIFTSLNAGDTAAAKKTLASIGQWFNEQQKAEGQKEKPGTAKDSTQADPVRASFNTAVAKSAESISNKLLGAALKSYLVSHFKGWSRESLAPIANTTKTQLYAALKADKSYQDFMDKEFAKKSPNRPEIERVHRETVSKLAKGIVDKTVKLMGYKPQVAPVAAAKVPAKAVASPEMKAAFVTKADLERPGGFVPPKPVHVKSRPANLDHEVKNAALLQISQKGFVKTPDGKGWVFVTWAR